MKDFQKTTITPSDICHKGNTRIANSVDEKGRPIKIVLSKDCTLKTPWNVSSYDGGSRCSLDIAMTEEMQNMATKRGVHTNLGEDSIDADTLKLFKTQDLSYVTLKKQSEQTKIGEGCAAEVSLAPSRAEAAVQGAHACAGA